MQRQSSRYNVLLVTSDASHVSTQIEGTQDEMTTWVADRITVETRRVVALFIFNNTDQTLATFDVLPNGNIVERA